MRMLLKGAAMVLTMAGTTLAIAGPCDAQGFTFSGGDRDRDGTSVSFSFGNVAYGYQDGYWDNDRSWHAWRNDRERQYYRDNHRDSYRDGYHHRYSNQGWMGDRSAVGVSFNSGSVAFGYQDGYWDNDRSWHAWRNDGERQYYRDKYRDKYRDGYHNRYSNQGWTGDRSAIGLSFNVGNVAYGYQDGYWDNDRSWHDWRNDDERRYYRDNYRDTYRDGYHHRYSNQGWMGDRSAIGVSFNFGDVAYGYQDGYWDNDHRWHNWRNRTDHDNYRGRQGNKYFEGNHDRYRGQGWQRD